MPLHVWVQFLQEHVEVPIVGCLSTRLKVSTFSCDIAYSESPAASRACCVFVYRTSRTTLPSRKVNRLAPEKFVTGVPLPRPRPRNVELYRRSIATWNEGDLDTGRREAQ